MDYELSRAHRLVKRFDKDLIARRNKDGVLQVCQLIRKWDAVEVEGLTVLYPREDLQLVFNCTDTWTASGKPVSWGLEPLYQKMRQISFDRRDELLKEIAISEEKSRESKDRALKSKCEAIAIETRDIYKKTFSDVNTATMDKSRDSRRKQDRSIKWR